MLSPPRSIAVPPYRRSTTALPPYRRSIYRLRDAMSIVKRYFTSDRVIRSYA